MSEEESKRKGIRNFAKRILQDEDGERPDVKDVLSSVLEMGDKARMESIRLVAKEVRGYAEALNLQKDLHDFLTNYSLEVTATFRLKPVKKDDDKPEKSE